MKNLCFILALCVMFFLASCGSSKETVYDDTDSGSQSGEKNDSDNGDSATDTVPDDADSQGDTTPDNGDSVSDEDTDTSDPTDDTDTSEPTDDADSSDSVSDDDADTVEEENACKNNPCQGIANSTGECIPKGTEEYSCECKENYTWENNLCNADSRVSNCTGLPANASWNSVSSITQTWNGTEWVPSTDAAFNTTESTTKCRFICNQNYSWNDSECVAETRTANCEGLPENAVWNNAASITQTWDDENWVPSSTGTYNQNSSTTECRFKCAQNYNWTGSQCVAASQQAECTGLPENALWNTVSDITQTWSGTAWVPTNASSFNETPSYSECRFVCKTNYTWNGVACAPDEMNAVACTGKPANAVWNTVSSITQTWNGTEWAPTTSATFNETPSTTECRFKCAENYEWKNSQCAAKSREVNCTALPTNAQWNTATKIMQTWDGNAWIPTNIGSFNTSASSSECYFKCNEHYTWNNTICAADQQPATCTGLPANAQWNSVSEITQTWNGNGWTPSTIGTYNTSASTSECRFKCNENYNWDSSTSTCIAATKPASCTGLPTNASWNTASSITQTWDGHDWVPSNAGTYNETASSTECRFKCNQHYSWKNSQCVADQQDVNCTGLPTNASWNSASSITQTWNGNAWTPSNAGTYNTTASSTECRYKCNTSYHWENSACVSNTKTNVACTGLPANSVWNTASTITQTWNGSTWTPSTTGVYNETASSTECRYKCSSSYHRENSACVSNTKTASCTGLPANASWNTASSITQTWNGSTYTPSTTGVYNETASSTECRYKCSSSYHWENSACVSNTKTASCTGLPTNAQWNSVSTITQNWNGSSWLPSTAGIYNETASSSECRYKCNEHYSWKDLQCIADQQDANCTGLPTNAQWNTASTITQTWNGSAWTPNTTGTYNLTASTSECRYKCKTNYKWDSSSKKCNAATRTTNCLGLPKNAYYCDGSSYTQTWNGSEWTPTLTASRCIAGSYTCYFSNKCCFECNSGYHYSIFNGVQGCWADKSSLSKVFYKICTGQNSCYNKTEKIDCPAENEDFFGQDAHYANQNTCTPQNFEIENIGDNNIVDDLNTGLYWQQTIPELTYTWDDAKKYCDELNYADYTDWRLPTPKEFLTIVDNSKYNPAVDTAYFTRMPNDTYFWTSEEYNNSDSGTQTPSAYYFDSHFGYISSNTKASAANVMCIRGNELSKSIFEIEKIGENEIVSDSATGIIWQKSYASDKNWQDALSYCENLEYAGYTDWRLPNKNDLVSLVKYGKYNPASDFPDMPSSYFWSSSTIAEINDYAWSVEFYSGFVSAAENKATENNVRCVRN